MTQLWPTVNHQPHQSCHSSAKPTFSGEKTDGNDMTASSKAKEDLVHSCLKHYEDALILQSNGNNEESLKILIQLSKENVISEVFSSSRHVSEEEEQENLSRKLAFGIYKNISTLLFKDNSFHTYAFKALSLDWSDVEIWKMLGSFHLQHGDYLCAIQCFRAGLEFIDGVRTDYSGYPLSITEFDCLKHLCETLLLIGDDENCARFCTIAIQIDSNIKYAGDFLAEYIRKERQNSTLGGILKLTGFLNMNQERLGNILSDKPAMNLEKYRFEIIHRYMDHLKMKATVLVKEQSHQIAEIVIPERNLTLVIKSMLDYYGGKSDHSKKLDFKCRLVIPVRSEEDKADEYFHQISMESGSVDVSSARMSSRLQKMLDRGNSIDSKYGILAANDSEMSLYKELKSILDESYLQPLPLDLFANVTAPLYDAMRLTSSDTEDENHLKLESILIIFRRILHSFCESTLHQARSARNKKRARRGTHKYDEVDSEEIVSGRWNEILFEDAEDDSGLHEDVILEIEKIREFDFITILYEIVKIVLLHMPTKLRYPRYLDLSVELIRVLCISSTRSSCLNLLLSIQDNSMNLLSRSLLISEILFDSFDRLKNDLPPNFTSSLTSEYLLLLDRFLGIVFEHLSSKEEENLEEKIRYWMLAARIEKSNLGITKKMAKYLRECVLQLGLLKQHTNREQVLDCFGNVISQITAEDDLHAIKAELFLQNISSKVFDRDLDRDVDQLLESIIFGWTLPLTDVISDLPNRVLVASIERLPLLTRFEIGESFIHRLKVENNLVSTLKHDVSLFHVCLKNMLSAPRLRFLFVEHWSINSENDGENSDRAENAAEILHAWNRLLLSSKRIISSLRDTQSLDPYNEIDKSHQESFLLFLAISWDMTLRAPEMVRMYRQIQDEKGVGNATSEEEKKLEKSGSELLKQFFVESINPWILHYHLIEHHYQKSFKSLSYLNFAHDFLGNHQLCGEQYGAFLHLILTVANNHLKEGKLSEDNSEICEIALYQSISCLYGLKITTEHLVDLQSHESFSECIPIPFDEKVAEDLYLLIEDRLKDRLDRRDIQDAVKMIESKFQRQCLHNMQNHGIISLNLENIELFLKRPIIPDITFSLDCLDHRVETVCPWSKGQSSISPVFKSLYFYKGLTVAQIALKSPILPEQTKKQHRIDMFLNAIESFRKDLMFNPSRWESWYHIGICCNAVIDEYMSWVVDHELVEYRKIVDLQRTSYRALAQSAILLERSSLESMEKCVNLAFAYSELGHIIYSMVARPMGGVISKTTSRKVRIIEEIVANSFADPKNKRSNFMSFVTSTEIPQKLYEQELIDEHLFEQLQQKSCKEEREYIDIQEDVHAFPESEALSRRIISPADKRMFYANSAVCFSRSRRLLAALNKILSRSKLPVFSEPYEWTLMLGKCCQKMGRESEKALRYFELSVLLSCSDWNSELSSPRSTPRAVTPVLEPIETICFNNFVQNEDSVKYLKPLPTYLSLFSSWRFTFTQPPPLQPLDALYKCLSQFAKLYVLYTPNNCAKIVDYIQRLNIDFSLSSTVPWEDYDQNVQAQSCLFLICQLAEIIMKYDKWYHRAIYRYSWFMKRLLQPENMSRLPYFLSSSTSWKLWASGKVSVISNLFQLKTKISNFWRTPFERSGKYAVYYFEYVSFLIDHVIDSQDKEILILLLKKKTRCSEILWAQDLWVKATEEYCKDFEKETKQKLGLLSGDEPWWFVAEKIPKKTLSKSIPVLEAALFRAMGENWDHRQRVSIGKTADYDELVELIKKLVEARKIATSVSLDHCFALVYSYIIIVKALIESWLSLRWSEHREGKMELNSVDDTVIEIEKPLSSVILWTLDKVDQFHLDITPPLSELKNMLSAMIRQDTRQSLKSEDEMVDRGFLTLKAVSILKGQARLARRTANQVGIQEEISKDTIEFVDIGTADQTVVLEEGKNKPDDEIARPTMNPVDISTAVVTKYQNEDEMEEESFVAID